VTERTWLQDLQHRYLGRSPHEPYTGAERPEGRRWGLVDRLVAASAVCVGAGGLVAVVAWDLRVFAAAALLTVTHYAAYWIPNAALLAQRRADGETLSSIDGAMVAEHRAEVGRVTPPAGTDQIEVEPFVSSGYQPPDYGSWADAVADDPRRGISD
jgi:hypothetical protein